ncbi:hypothetical protein KY320_02765, partial [Candidatus Woesearchaeota archaeon]|nr:hypothetical protein [Candidatus Woesearchaeota archaeon]
MVLEQLVKVRWLEKKEHSFLIGMVYTIVGMLSAYLVFSASFDLMSFAFTSILLIPSLAMLLKLEENIEIRERKLSLPMLFKDHWDIFKVYLSLFLGIFFVYAAVAFIIPTASSEQLFRTQLAPIFGLRG